jgi:hypothetical protein
LYDRACVSKIKMYASHSIKYIHGLINLWVELRCAPQRGHGGFHCLEAYKKWRVLVIFGL